MIRELDVLLGNMTIHSPKLGKKVDETKPSDEHPKGEISDGDAIAATSEETG